jgi:hypothetical protein
LRKGTEKGLAAGDQGAWWYQAFERLAILGPNVLIRRPSGSFAGALHFFAGVRLKLQANFSN